MKAYCDFPSEIFVKAIYKIDGDYFSFTKRNCVWNCRLDEMDRLIKLIEKAIWLPIGYDTPPIKVKGIKRVITIAENDNHLCMNEQLLIKFLEELKSVYDVYG